MQPLTIGEINVEPGKKHRTTLGTIRNPSGSEFGIPCLVAHGVEEGPTLVLSGATHGNEIAGTGAVIRVMQALDPLKMKGSVIAVPAANVAAFDQGAYLTPQDSRNMASGVYWNTDPKGTVTARMGALLGPLYQMADYYIDLHGNHEPCVPMSMMYLSSTNDLVVREKTVALADAFGVTPVDMSDPVAHPYWIGAVDDYPVPTAMANGVPALMVELMMSHTCMDAERGLRGVMNVMRILGMIEGDQEGQMSPRALPGRYRYWGSIGAQAAGLLWPKVAPGELVSKGETVAEITNLFGDVLEVVASPADGFVWAFLGAGAGTFALPEGSDIGFFAERVS
ncbi:succinylglutamate desuccinylase/aspartoacylase family protein [Burkholderia sp. R-69980]|nr:succinylglutamate desuccinylase/aspartoacylase family protein [Burkholderia sp. R-69980]